MIIEYLRYTVEPDLAEDFIKGYSAAAEPLMASAWCMSFNMACYSEDPTQFTLRTEWTSANDYLKRFRSSE